MTSPEPVHYRIQEVIYESGVHIRARACKVYKTTPEGYWLYTSDYAPDWMTFTDLRRGGYLRWVSKHSARRFAYPTMQEALHSYERRKIRQLQYAKHAIELAETALAGIKQCSPEDTDRLIQGVNVGKLPSHDQWIFD